MAVSQLPQTDAVDLLSSSRGQASLGLGDLSIWQTCSLGEMVSWRYSRGAMKTDRLTADVSEP
jgi:hypothetical protein